MADESFMPILNYKALGFAGRLAVSIAVISLAVACSSDNANVKGLSEGDADKLNAQHSQFDSAEDPPISPDTFVAAAELAQAQDNPPLAIAQYQKALAINPKHRRATYGLAMLYTNMKDYDLATAGWEKYVDLTDGSAAAYANLGYCQELAGHPEAAEAAYKKGIAADAQSVPCRVNYGLMLARRGQVAEATLQWQAVLTPGEVHYNLASVYERQGRKEQAKVEYKKALELEPDMNDARTRLGALEGGGL